MYFFSRFLKESYLIKKLFNWKSILFMAGVIKNRNFYQNRFINECARKKKSRNPVVFKRTTNNSLGEIKWSRAVKLYSLVIALTPVDNQLVICTFFVIENHWTRYVLRLFLGQGIPPYFHSCCLALDRVPAVGTLVWPGNF